MVKQLFIPRDAGIQHSVLGIIADVHKYIGNEGLLAIANEEAELCYRTPPPVERVVVRPLTRWDTWVEMCATSLRWDLENVNQIMVYDDSDPPGVFYTEFCDHEYSLIVAVMRSYGVLEFFDTPRAEHPEWDCDFSIGDASNYRGEDDGVSYDQCKYHEFPSTEELTKAVLRMEAGMTLEEYLEIIADMRDSTTLSRGF